MTSMHGPEIDAHRKTPVFETEFFLTAGESNARGEMPVSLIAERLIEVATRHANLLGIGFATLSPLNVAWVLVRLLIEMDSVPRINQTYRITTWIESWKRFYSIRCFRISDDEGRTLGWGKTVWATIDTNRRSLADVSYLGSEYMLDHKMTCPLEMIRKHPMDKLVADSEITFRFTDLDFNRHVNSVKYIDHILNLWPLEHFDRYRVKRFDIAYRHECLCGQTVQLRKGDDESGTAVAMFRDDECVVAALIGFVDDPV